MKQSKKRYLEFLEKNGKLPRPADEEITDSFDIDDIEEDFELSADDILEEDPMEYLSGDDEATNRSFAQALRRGY